MLTPQEIKQLLEKGEGTRIEFKEAQNGVPDTLYDTVTSFLNKEGGIILLGVNDDGQVLGLESLPLEPISLEELVNSLGYKSKERFRDDYVKPLKDNYLISYTIPDNPNDPNQAYVITQRGKDFIGGFRI